MFDLFNFQHQMAVANGNACMTLIKCLKCDIDSDKFLRLLSSVSKLPLMNQIVNEELIIHSCSSVVSVCFVLYLQEINFGFIPSSDFK